MTIVTEIGIIGLPILIKNTGDLRSVFSLEYWTSFITNFFPVFKLPRALDVHLNK